MVHLEFLLAVNPAEAHELAGTVEGHSQTALLWGLPSTSLYIIDRDVEKILWCKEAIDFDNVRSDTDGLATALALTNAVVCEEGEVSYSYHYTFVEEPRKRLRDKDILKHYYPFLYGGFKLLDEDENENY